jgi:hypothetical protein
MAICTVADVSALAPELSKLYLMDYQYQAAVAAIIPNVEADFLSIRNRPFDVDAAGGTVYPAGSTAIAVEMIRYRLGPGSRAGLASEKTDLLGESLSYDADLIAGYPRSIAGRIQRFMGVK